MILSVLCGRYVLVCMPVSSWRSWNYLCILCSVQVLHYAANRNVDPTQMKNDICKKSVSKKICQNRWGGGGVSGLNMENHSFIRGRLIVAPPVHLLFISLTTRRLKLINNLFCYFSDRLNILEVWVIDCAALIKKCSSNFLEQCMHIMAPSKQGHFSFS